jgi:hypothetical protein
MTRLSVKILALVCFFAKSLYAEAIVYHHHHHKRILFCLLELQEFEKLEQSVSKFETLPRAVCSSDALCS